MSIVRRVVAVAVLAAVLAGSAGAQEPAPVARTRDPRLAATAVILNIFYVPVRFTLTAVGAVLGGFTGFITLGDREAAQAIWGLTDGSMVITPEMLQGTEQFHFSAYD